MEGLMSVGEIVVKDTRYGVYLKDMGKIEAGNVTPENTGANKMNAETDLPQQTGGKKKKGTRKLSGYMKFAQEVRPRVLKEDPSMKSDITKVGRKIGEMWRSLSTEEKARY